jgi:pectin methylesterase-like acyl-CoA thioesterase
MRRLTGLAVPVVLLAAPLLLPATAFGQAQTLPVLTVAPPESAPAAQYTTIQAAVTAAPDTGAVIRIRPGIYREVVHIDKPGIQLRGETKDPARVEIVYANGASNTCGTFCSPTVFVTGDGFIASNLTIANDWSKNGQPRTQAVALSISADRAVLRHVRLLGAQDTLLATSKPCKAGTPTGTPDAAPCHISRQFFDHCYIEGEVDFIFGNARAVFDNCEIHSIPHQTGGFLTAQSRTSLDQDSGYVFDHCTVTAAPGVEHVFLGRPWRDFATVTFLHTYLSADIEPAGWSEWHVGETDRLKTAHYAEFDSTGPGANAKAREPLSKQLTAGEAEAYEPDIYLRGRDDWMPATVR